MNLEQLHGLVSIAVSGVPTSENTREQLVRSQLIRNDTPELTDRGQVFLAHVLGLPLPESVPAWRMPGASVTVSAAGPVQPGEPLVEDEGVAPPPPPPASMLPKVDIPTDPVALKARALQLADSGFGLGEVSRMLQLTPEQSQAIFYGG